MKEIKSAHETSRSPGEGLALALNIGRGMYSARPKLACVPFVLLKSGPRFSRVGRATGMFLESRLLWKNPMGFSCFFRSAPVTFATGISLYRMNSFSSKPFSTSKPTETDRHFEVSLSKEIREQNIMTEAKNKRFSVFLPYLFRFKSSSPMKPYVRRNFIHAAPVDIASLRKGGNELAKTPAIAFNHLDFFFSMWGGESNRHSDHLGKAPRRLSENREPTAEKPFWPDFPFIFVKERNYSPQMNKKPDSKELSLARASILGQPPRHFMAVPAHNQLPFSFANLSFQTPPQLPTRKVQLKETFAALFFPANHPAISLQAVNPAQEKVSIRNRIEQLSLALVQPYLPASTKLKAPKNAAVNFVEKIAGSTRGIALVMNSLNQMVRREIRATLEEQSLSKQSQSLQPKNDMVKQSIHLPNFLDDDSVARKLLGKMQTLAQEERFRNGELR